MKLKAFVLIALAFSFFFVGGVRAEEVDVVGDVAAEEVNVPNPESPFFGLQVAWMNITDNFQVWLARTDEKKTDLEVKFAEREAILMDRIVLASENNPELADALEKQLDNLEDRHDKRLERIDIRITGFESKSGDMEQRMSEWQEKIQTRREVMEQKKEEIQERIKIMEGEQLQDQLQDGSGDDQQAGSGEGNQTGVGVGHIQSQSVDLKGSVQKVGGR